MRTIILYYYCDQPSSFSQAPSACGVQCSTERLVYIYVCTVYIREFGHSLCRIDGYSSDANIKIHGDGSAILKILILIFFFLKVETG